MNVKNEKSKKVNILHIVALYTCFTLLYLIGDSSSAAIIYFIIGIWSYVNPLILFSLLGASNYLPAISGLSPLLISVFIMIIVSVTYFKRFDKTMPKGIYTKFALLILIIIWSFFSSDVHEDTSFMSSMITILICYVALNMFLAKFESRGLQIDYLIAGVGFGIMLALLIQLNVDGFESYHPFRLAIGERADPNSTGLLMAIFCVYVFVKCINKINDGIRKTVINIVFILLGFWIILLTQSRGSIICVIITVAVYLIFVKKKNLNGKGIVTVLCVSCFALVVLVLTEDLIFNMFDNALDDFIFRIETTTSKDGERLYLLEKSFESFIKHPIFGTSLSDFENSAGHIPHNAFSDFMVTNGIVGIIFFIFMYALPIVKMYPKKHLYHLHTDYFCYFVCFLNILCYSASNEKMTVVLLVILMHSMKHESSPEAEKAVSSARSNRYLKKA